MTFCGPEFDIQSREAGFATALAMAVSLSIGLGATALLIRSAADLASARRVLERSQAEYRLDAVQRIAAEEFYDDPGGLKLRRVGFDEAVATVRQQPEAAKLLPSAASNLPDGWFTALGVADPNALRSKIASVALAQPLTTQRLADLDPSPSWKACAADGVSMNGALSGKVAETQAVQISQTTRVVRLTASTDGGWVDDRVVRLSDDPANPVVVLDRRFYRHRGAEIVCPDPPKPKESA